MVLSPSFEWCFPGGPMMARFYWYLDPLSPLSKNCVRVRPPLTTFWIRAWVFAAFKWSPTRAFPCQPMPMIHHHMHCQSHFHCLDWVVSVFNLTHRLCNRLDRGSYMSAHVLLILLNELGKRDKMRGLPSILSLFRNEFNKFNNTRARMLDSIYHMTNTLKSHFWHKTL